MKFDPSDSLEYGKYLTTIAGCGGCHTKSEKGEPIAGMEFAGGEEFQFPGGIVRSLNITPDNETGIGLWTKELFIKRFKAYTNDSSKVIPVSENDFNTPMPWLMYAGMTEADLGSVYDYLRTVRAVKNKVQSFSKSEAARK
jgi:hypothetical protein